MCASGFTLIEAIVAMAIFGIAFSGLYLMFGIAIKASDDVQTRMHLNLISNQIVESISSEARRSMSDVKNPFKTPTLYSGNLHSCTTSITDVRQNWCRNLNDVVGPHQALNVKQKRQITLEKSGNHLYVDIELVVGGGKTGIDVISVAMSRRIRP